MKLGYPFPTLTDDRVTLRPWSDSDLACVEEASHDPRILEVTTVPRAYTPEAGLAFVARQHSRVTGGEVIALAIAEASSGEAIGHITLLCRPQRGVAGIGYWLLARKRGKHLGLYAVRLLSRWGLQEAGLARIEALVEPANIPSMRVLERAGFQREGLLRAHLALKGRRADVYSYSLLPEDLEK